MSVIKGRGPLVVLVTSVVLRNGDFTFHGLSEKDCMNSANLLTRLKGKVQRSAKRLVQGLVNFVPALAYLFCLALPGSCLARFTYLLADLCTVSHYQMLTEGVQKICGRHR